MRLGRLVYALGVLVFLLAGTLHAQQDTQGGESQEGPEVREEISAELPWLVAQEEQSLARLVAWCSHLLELDVQFDPAKLTDVIRLRVTRMMTGREIWDVTNLALAERGLTSVQAAGQDFLTITTLPEAKDLARIEKPDLVDAWAGYVRVLVTLEHVEAQEVRDML